MQINTRVWARTDLVHIQQAWLHFCLRAARSDMRLKTDGDLVMREWLVTRFEDPGVFGLVAENGGAFVGFLIGRIGEWESIPPLVEPRKLGIIDALYVDEDFRRKGIGTRLIERAVQMMRDRHATAVETTYDIQSAGSLETWNRAGFTPWMVHAYRML